MATASIWVTKAYRASDMRCLTYVSDRSSRGTLQAGHCFSLMADTVRYEVILVPSEISRTSSDWTWRRLERDGGIAAQGVRHETMKACFAELRAHMTVFGEAKITVNLHGEEPTFAVDGAADGAAPIDHSRVSPMAPLKRRVNRQVALRH